MIVDSSAGYTLTRVGGHVEYQPPYSNTAQIVSLVADIAEMVGQVTIFEG